MPSITIVSVLQVVIALGLLNVWLIRSGAATAYRGGDATSLKAEFDAYGLPPVMFYVVGALKIGSAIALLVGLWLKSLVLPAAAIVALLMLGALAMHAKVSDPVTRYLPALAMFIMSATVVALSL